QERGVGNSTLPEHWVGNATLPERWVGNATLLEHWVANAKRARNAVRSEYKKCVYLLAVSEDS
ncbi:MAG: hypothetical protein ABEI31_10765, partial [Halodesulfurarchaeum sp.]